MLNQELASIPIIILAGGKGLYVDNSGQRRAKGEVEINGKSLLEWIVLQYRDSGFRTFILSGGHRLEELKTIIFRAYRTIDEKNGNYRLADDMGEVSFRFIDSGIESKTGDRVKAAEEYIQADVFGVTYSDSYAPVNLQKIYLNFKSQGKIGSLLGVRFKPRFRALGVRSGDSLVRGFSDDVFMPGQLINGGYYFFKKEVLSLPISWKVLETGVLERLVEMRELDSYIYNGPFSALDSERDIDKFTSIISNNDGRK